MATGGHCEWFFQPDKPNVNFGPPPANGSLTLNSSSVNSKDEDQARSVPWEFPQFIPEPGTKPFPDDPVVRIPRIPPTISIGAGLTALLLLIPESIGDEPMKPEESRRLLALRDLKPYTGHGNKDEDWNIHIVYEFTFAAKDGRTPILKYGISDEFKNGWDRPDLQLQAFRVKYGMSVNFFILARLPDRISAKAFEQKCVDQHISIWGEYPREQIFPRGKI